MEDLYGILPHWWRFVGCCWQSNTTSPTDEQGNVDAFKRLKQLNAKAEFVLKWSISHGLFDHIMRCNSAHEIWRTLDRLFNKKDEARFQILENELANTTQGHLSISVYFLKIKNLCPDISLLNLEEGNFWSSDKKNYYSRIEAEVHSICDIDTRMGSTTILGGVRESTILSRVTSKANG